MPSLPYVTSDPSALQALLSVGQDMGCDEYTGGAVGSRENKKRPAVGGPRPRTEKSGRFHAKFLLTKMV
jgi:hypothetical protein